LGLLLLYVCGSDPQIDPGIFFPTWDPEGPVETAILQERTVSH
jgi:hypothetical protein